MIGTQQNCWHCGMIHFSGGQCPRIKAIEYYPDGTVKRVEYHEMTLPMPHHATGTAPCPPFNQEWKFLDGTYDPNR